MSAHLCSDQDIDVIVDFARSIPPRERLSFAVPPVHYGLNLGGMERFDPREFPDQFGRALLMANWESVQARYAGRVGEYFGNGEDAMTYRAKQRPRLYAMTPGKAADELGFVLKQLDHYDYQACEVTDYRSTWAAAVVDHLRRWAVTNLPGYRAAPWGL